MVKRKRKYNKRKYNKRKYKKRKRQYGIKLKKKTLYTLSAVWLWLLSILITLSFFTDGTVLSVISRELSLYLGWTYYMLPPFLVSLSLLLFDIKSDIGKPHVPLGYLMMMLSFMGLTQAGLIGESVWEVVADGISQEGAAVIFIGIFVISLIVMFNTSLDMLIDMFFKVFNKAGTFIISALSQLTDMREKKLQIGQKSSFTIKGSDDYKSKMHEKDDQKTSAKSLTAKDENKLDLKIASTDQRLDMSMWKYPPLSLLSDTSSKKANRGDVRRNAEIIEKTLDSFGIKARVSEVNTAPAVTQYALEIALGTKVRKITSLSNDLALALAAKGGQVRIEAPIPGKNLVGIEIPNQGLEIVTLKRMLTSDELKKNKSKLAVALGLDVSGKPIVTEIGKMPHVLIAGTTGSGKSVLVNSWINSLLFRTTPQELRMIMVDPKRVELTIYNGIPHLLTPVIVESDKILSALNWAISEMKTRYKKFAEVGVRNIDGFNNLSGFHAMPYIVIVIDELAHLMEFAPADVEEAICRLAQMARATGIHLVLATQRPSVDVITGLIKANIPARIAFNVASMVDSKVIIDMPGAEKLLGRGDMLFIPPDQAKPSRIQGTFVSELEVGKVVDFFKTNNPPVEYTQEVLTHEVKTKRLGKGGLRGSGTDEKDSLFEDAIRLICQHDKASASLLQRRLSVGYARAARILDQLETEGIVSLQEGSKPRDVLIKSADEYFARVQETQEPE